MLEQPVPEGLHHVVRTHFREVSGELSPARGTFTLEQGRSVRSPPPEGQGAAETTCDELTTTPFPIRLHHSGEGSRETGVKLSPGRRRGKVF